MLRELTCKKCGATYKRWDNADASVYDICDECIPINGNKEDNLCAK